ncbi:MAG: gluconate:H+ symporter [Bacteroidota bacterium]|nr:gluconate:H+ symporter [Bacteroidota bacterium]
MPLIIVAAGVLCLLILIVFFKLDAFIALIIVALGVGIAEGMPVASAIKSIEEGVGSTLGSLALILGFGAMLGKMVGDSGAAQRITSFLINKFGRSYIQWALVITGFVVGIPMFYTAGFVILIPIVFTVAATTRLPLLYVGIPMVAALSVTHGYLPPHPAPTAIAVMYNADIGLTLVYGIIIAIPAIILAGPLFARLLTKYRPEPPKGLYQPRVLAEEELPSFSNSIFTALLPVILIVIAALAKFVLDPESIWMSFFNFVGDPIIALLLSVIVAIFTLGLFRGRTMTEIMVTVKDSISSIAMILLVIGGGGAFKEVLVDSGVSDYVANMITGTGISPLVLAWGISALLRVSLGSATVAALTTAGITLPMIATSSVSPELMVLATGAGSLMFSHVNDPGFWIFKEYFNLTIVETLSTWSVMETIVSVMGLVGVMLFSYFI